MKQLHKSWEGFSNFFKNYGDEPWLESVSSKKKEDKVEKMDMSSESPSISKKERIKITNHIHGNKVLGGNVKVDSISKGLWELGDILDSCGFSLDMVTGDMINAPKGNILLPFRRKNENPFIEGPEIENSRISFSWENLEATPEGHQFKKRYEIIAYLT